ncbi:MAG: ribosome biogenesis GTP-binding protein YihA/YsxC [Bacteroidota bacterium]
MKIKEAEYLISSALVSQCPKPDKPEYAFIGRSNVGKSSLINMITSKEGLAKTSQTPGKTQLINHFLINKNWYLVDLPGYGYARVSKTEREKFEKMINNYLFERENLINTFVLVDIRHKPQSIDLEFMEKLGLNGVPFSIIFTKADKLSKLQIENHINDYTQLMLESWESMPQYFISSASAGLGKDEINAYIDSLHSLFKA